MNESSNRSCDASTNSETPSALRAGDANGPGLFEAFGVEIEYMAVDRTTLAVKPVVDRLLASEAGAGAQDVVGPQISWSNELVNHVVELKTTEPVAALTPSLGKCFQEEIGRIHAQLAGMDARLMPGAMHPWMDPDRETMLWPHGGGDIYAAFHRVFDCRGHGWANLQSMHLNLPFQGSEEFGRLHAAVRLLLPILPALAASSPFAEGKFTGDLDYRLKVYRTNCRRVPECTGDVVPEPVFSTDEYHTRVLTPLYKALAPHDPEGVLQEEWANARGAIARFSRNTIEVRVIDAQECPAADVAVAAAAVAAVRGLAGEEWSSWVTQKGFGVAPLVSILEATIHDGERAAIRDEAYLRAMGHPVGSCTAGELWRHLIRHGRGLEGFEPMLHLMTEKGPLARRLLRAVGMSPTHAELMEEYIELCNCCLEGKLFERLPRVTYL